MDLRVSPQTDHARTRPGAREAPPHDSEPGAEPYALLGIELRRVHRPGTKIVGDIEEVVLNSCVMAVVEVLTAGGAEIEVERTSKRPVVEARFEGKVDSSVASRAVILVMSSIMPV